MKLRNLPPIAGLKILSSLALTSITLVLSSPAFAADGSYDTNANSTWSTAGSWSGGTIADGSGFTANFTFDITADRVVTLDGPRTLGNLVFSDPAPATAGSWTISGANTLTLAGGTSVLTVNALGAGKTATISSVIAGSAGLTKAGTGTLVLSGSNTYTGGTFITGGTLQANALASLQGAVTVNAAATLLLNAPNITWPNTITGSGTLNVFFVTNSAANTRLSGVGGFGGTIQLSNDGGTGDKFTTDSLSASGATVLVENASQLYVNTTATFSGVRIQGTGNLEDRGAIRLAGTLNAPVTLLASSTLGTEAGTITGAITGTATIGNTHTLTLGTVNSVAGGTLSGVISDGVDGGKLAVVKTQSGVVAISNTNTFSGGTTVNGGTLDLNGTDSGGAGPVTVNGGTLDLSGANSGGRGSLTLNGGTTRLVFTANDTGKLDDAAVLTLAGGTLNLSGGTHTELVGSTTLAAGTASTVSRSDGGAVVALGEITRETGACLNFGNSGIATTTSGSVGQAFGPWMTIGGTALATVDGSGSIVALTTSTDVPTVTGTLVDGAASDVRITNNVAGAVAPGGISGDTLTVNSITRSVTGLATLNAADRTLRVRNGILSGAGSGGITIGTASNAGVLTAGDSENTAGTLAFNALAGGITVNSTIANNGSGAVAVIKSGTADVTLAGTNTYSGGTTLSSGFLRVSSSDSALGSGPLTFAGNAILATASGGAARNLANPIILDPGMTGSFDSGYANLTLSGGISGAGNVATLSSGTTIFPVANNYTGTTTVGSNSTLQVGTGGSAGTLGTGAVSVAGTLAYNRSGTIIHDNLTGVGAAGILSVDGGAILNLQGGSSLLPANLTINHATVNLTGGGFAKDRMQGNGVVTINPGGLLVIPAGNPHALGGDNAIMTETIVINGGTLTLNQEQYLKTFTLNGGTIDGTNEFRVATSSSSFQATGTTPSLVSCKVNHFNTGNWTVADVTASPAVDLTISGQVIGVAMTKDGLGTLLLSNANNTYTGATTVTAGRLLVTGTKNGGGAVSVAAAATLGGTGTVLGDVSVAGALQPGTNGIGALATGPLTLTGSYACEVDGAAFDSVAVSGNLNLTGSTLAVGPTGAGLTQGSYVIATWTGTRSGNFATITGAGDYTVAYDDANKQVLLVEGISYASWIASFPGVAGAPGFGQDADLDGIPNGIEHVLGTDPSQRSAGLVQVSTTSTSLKFRHSRSNTLAIDVMPSYQWSSDLVNWHPSGGTNSGGTTATINPVTVTDTSAPANDLIEVTITITAGPATRLFGRLVAGRP